MEPPPFQPPPIDPVPRELPRPFWSVMIPAFNRTAFLERTLRAVLQQDPGPDQMQIEVLDDASTQDDLEAIVRQMGQGRVQFYRHPRHLGMVENFNAAVQRCRGRWVHILPDDDLPIDGFYRRLRQGIEQAPDVKAAFCRFGFIDEHDRMVAAMAQEASAPGVLQNWIELLGLRQRVQSAAIVVNRDAYQQLGAFCPQLFGAATWEMYQRIAALGPVWYEPQLLAACRQHDLPRASRSFRSAAALAGPRLAIAAAHRYLPADRADAITGQARADQAQLAIGAAQQLLQSGDFDAAVVQIREAFLLNSSPPFVQQARQALAALAAAAVSPAVEAASKSLQQPDLEAVGRFRHALALVFLDCPSDALPGLLDCLELAHLHLAESPITQLAIEPEPSVLPRLAEIQDLAQPQRLLAAMLYYQAHQIPLPPRLEDAPPWLQDRLWRYILNAPRGFYEFGEARQYYRFLKSWVDYLHAATVTAGEPPPRLQRAALQFLQMAVFPLYPTDSDLREFHVAHTRIVEAVLRRRGYELDARFGPRPPGRTRIRVGILSTGYGPATDTYHTLPEFELLDRSRFEIILYRLGPGDTPTDRYCEALAHRVVTLSGELPQQVRTVRGDDLDVLLINTNITFTTNALVVLAAHRLARVQCALYGCPVTTGWKNMDVYISGKLSETDGAAARYSERLELLEGTGFCFHYLTDEHPVPPTTRADLGIAQDAIVFASGAAVLKLIPEVVQTFIQVLHAVPGSVLVLFPFSTSWGTDAFSTWQFTRMLHQIAAKYQIDPARLKVFRLPTRDDVVALLRLADVYLDSYLHGGSHTMIDPLQAAVPPVTLEAQTMRSRLGAAILRDLDLAELITHDELSYVALAVALARDPQRRRHLADVIRQKMAATPRFLDPADYSAQIGALSQRLIARWEQSFTSSDASSPPADR